MAIPLLKDVPLTPPADLGPYRRKDYEALPDEPRCELIYGRFYVSPSPIPLHQDVVHLLGEKLRQIARTAGGLMFIAPLDVYFDDHSVVQPDVMYISSARRAILQETKIEGAPDLLIEVVSPRTARNDRGDKLRLYADSGVQEYWIVEPRYRQIEFLRNEGGSFVVVVPEGPEYRSSVLPEIRFDIVGFWREIEEQIPSTWTT